MMRRLISLLFFYASPRTPDVLVAGAIQQKSPLPRFLKRQKRAMGICAVRTSKPVPKKRFPSVMRKSATRAVKDV